MKLKSNYLAPAMVILAALGVTGIHIYSIKKQLPDGLVQANGRIETEHTFAATKIPGRISAILVKEGETVVKGQPLIVIEDPQITTKAEQARQAVAALTRQLEFARASLRIAEQEVPLGIQAAYARVHHADAVVKKARAAESQAKKDLERVTALYEDGSIERHKQEMATLAAIAASSDAKSANAAHTRALQGLLQAQLGDEKINAQKIQVSALEAQIAQAQAVQQEIGSVVEDLTIKAPSDGVVATCIRDLGEVIAPGAPVIELIDSDNLYVKAYVQENLIGKISLGVPARVYIDTYPDQPIPARVTYISQQAEFTPKEVQTPDERTKLVYAVKVTLENNANSRLSAGLPADIILRWNTGVDWHAPQG